MLTAPLLLTGCGLSFPATPSRGVTVAVKVRRGAQHARTIILPIYIDGSGPYDFELDTGAAKSVVDTGIASRIGLVAVGPVPGGIDGVVSSRAAIEVEVPRWRLSRVALRPDTVIATSLSELNGHGNVDGLLGSDELSWFRSVTVDYQRSTITFTPG